MLCLNASVFENMYFNNTDIIWFTIHHWCFIPITGNYRFLHIMYNVNKMRCYVICKLTISCYVLCQIQWILMYAMYYKRPRLSAMQTPLWDPTTIMHLLRVNIIAYPLPLNFLWIVCSLNKSLPWYFTNKSYNWPVLQNYQGHFS